MWQNLDMSEMARVHPSAFRLGKAPHMEIFDHLRDFSIRQLPDEVVEILETQDGPDEDNELPSTIEVAAPEVDESKDVHNSVTDSDDVPEMTPFSLEEGEEKEHQQSKAEPELDIDALKNEAFAMGQEMAKASYEVERARLVEAHRLALAEARQTLINNMGADLAATCAQGFEELQLSLQELLARLIIPLVGEKLTRDAVTEFVQILANETIETHLPLILEGDQALLDAFIVQAQKEPALNLENYQFKAQSDSVLRLVLGDEILSTRLSPLLQQLREII